MRLSNSASKHRASTGRDVESGDGIDRSTTPRPFDETTKESATPDSRLSGEFTESRPRRRWHDSDRWTNLRNRVPPPLSHATEKVVQWVKGPQPPRKYQIRPLLESIQTFPTKLLARLPKPARIFVFVCGFLLWIVVFGVLLSRLGLPKDIAGFGAPVRLSCVSTMWYVTQAAMNSPCAEADFT